jgi:hypothetical protein
MADNLKPELNILGLAGNLGNVVELANKLSNPATLAQLQADGKLALDDVQKLMADAHQAADDLNKLVTDLRAALGV